MVSIAFCPSEPGGNAIVEVLSFGLKTVGNLVGGVVNIFDKDLGKTIQNSTKVTADKFSNNFKYAFKEVEKAGKKIDVFSLFGGKKKGGETTKESFKADTSNLDLLKAQENYYKDDLFMRRYYALKRDVVRVSSALSKVESYHKREVTMLAESIKDTKEEFNTKLTAMKEEQNKAIDKLESKIDTIAIQNIQISNNLAELTGYLRGK